MPIRRGWIGPARPAPALTCSTSSPRSSSADLIWSPVSMHTIGVDFGTNSCRAIVVSCADGTPIGTGVSEYHSGDHGVLTHPSDPHLARQNPADYIGSLGHAITAALADASRTPGFSRDQVIGIGVDTTGSTPLPIDAKARPLSIDARFEGDLAAQAWLWKDHTAAEEAAAITAIAKQ